MPIPETELPEDRVEATFVLLEEGRKLESESRFWPATEKYIQAQSLLAALAEEKSAEAAGIEVDKPAEEEQLPDEKQQIAKLYAAKADEYWKQSRKCLILAMEEEKKLDEQDDPPNIRDLLDDDQAKSRNASFSALFSRIVVVEEEQAAADSVVAPPPLASGSSVVAPQGGDLESRLRALNQSLPSSFKSVDERMADVHKGMGKLGMSSVYSQPKKSSYALNDDELEKSEDEQIEEILAQAKDEVMVDRMNRESGGDGAETKAALASMKKRADDDDDDSGFGDSSSESGDSEGDEHLDNDQLGMKTIRKKVAKAQAKLAEILALVDRARSKRAEETAEEDEAIYKNNGLDADSSDDEDSFREVQKHDVAFLMMSGKKKLKSAKRDLKKALAEWEELIL